MAALTAVGHDLALQHTLTAPAALLTFQVSVSHCASTNVVYVLAGSQALPDSLQHGLQAHTHTHA